MGMPKLVAYDGRFELIRMAVVRVAALEGAAAVSFARVGEELRLSPSSVRRTMQYHEGVLEVLGLQLLQRRWNMRYRFGLSGREESESLSRSVEPVQVDESTVRWWENERPRVRPAPVHRGIAQFRRLLPVDEDDVWDARAWAELVGGSGRHRLADVQQFIDWRHDLFDEGTRGVLARLDPEADPSERKVIVPVQDAVALRVRLDGMLVGLVERTLTIEEVDALVELDLAAFSPDGGGSPR
jgi:hypothetical protein